MTSRALATRGQVDIIRPGPYRLTPEQKTERDKLKTARILARIQANQQLYHDLMNNPLFTLVVGTVAIQLLQKYFGDRGITGLFEKAIGEGAVISIAGLQALQPAFPLLSQMTDQGGKALGEVMKLAGPAIIAGL